MSLLLCDGGDCCLRWLDGEPPEESNRPCGLEEPLTAWPRVAGDGERRLEAARGDRASLPGLAGGGRGLLRWRGGELEEGGERLRGGGELRRLGDRLEGRRRPIRGERLGGELDIFLLGGGSGDGL